MATTSMIIVVLVFWCQCLTSKGAPHDGCNCQKGSARRATPTPGLPGPTAPPSTPATTATPGLPAPPAPSTWNISMNPPNIYWNITVPLTINYNNSSIPAPNITSLPAPVALPNNTVIYPNGTVRFPNNTVLLTSYTPNAVRPVARLPSGILMFTNGAKVAAGTVTMFPAPGVPLNATEEAATLYPSVLLPNNTLVFRNGTILTPGMVALSTIFAKGLIPNCVGVTCHYLTS